jgi:hypothetical protein
MVSKDGQKIVLKGFGVLDEECWKTWVLQVSFSMKMRKMGKMIAT